MDRRPPGRSRPSSRGLDGRWTADSARSQTHPANPWRTAIVAFDVDGDDIRISDIVVDASGREDRHINTIRADGVEHPSGRGDGYTLLAKWRDARTLEAVGMKDGQVVGSVTYQVSTDGGTLTISSDQQLVVLNRLEKAAV